MTRTPLLLLVFMCLFFLVAASGCKAGLEQEKKEAAIKHMGTLDMAVKTYYLDHNDKWPPTLEALLVKDEFGGPYLLSKEALKTPWEGVFVLDAQATKTQGRPVIRCESPFGVLSNLGEARP